MFFAKISTTNIAKEMESVCKEFDESPEFEYEYLV